MAYYKRLGEGSIQRARIEHVVVSHGKDKLRGLEAQLKFAWSVGVPMTIACCGFRNNCNGFGVVYTKPVRKREAIILLLLKQ